MHDIHLRSRGAASLVVVMVLFFLMMMAVVFNGRSLIFEQKTSANQYRYTQAFEAGEAGLQWALTLLNSGRIDANCTSSAEVTDSTFRDRYLTTNVDTGQLQPVAGVTAGCVRTPGGWSCSCPIAGQAALVASPGSANMPAFTIQFSAAPQSGMVSVKARSCSSFGTQCAAAATERSDAYVEVDSLFALAGGLRAPPSAALTALGNVAIVGTNLRVTNADDETNGVTINAGGTISGNPQLTSTPGTIGSQSIVAADSSISTLASEEKLFITFLGSDKAAFQRLSSVRRVTCSSDCGAAIQTAYDEGYRMVWISSNAAIGGSRTLGSATDPLLVVANGNLQLGDTARLYGVVYSGGTLSDDGGAAEVHGAAIAEGNFTGSGSTHFVYDPDVLARLHFRTGTFARVPGSWSDTR
jgi:Tfp pilus assembly protein PilX